MGFPKSWVSRDLVPHRPRQGIIRKSYVVAFESMAKGYRRYAFRAPTRKPGRRRSPYLFLVWLLVLGGFATWLYFRTGV